MRKEAIETAIAAADKEIESYGALSPGEDPELLYGPTSDMAKQTVTKAMAAYEKAATITTIKQFDALCPGTVVLDGGDVRVFDHRGQYGSTPNAQFWSTPGWGSPDVMHYADLRGARILHWGRP